MIIEVPQEEYEYFRERVRHWMDFFGLRDWSVVTEFVDCGEDNRASTSRRTDNHCATIALGKTLDTKKFVYIEGREIIDRTAFHEVCHVLLADLVNIAESRYINDGEIVVAEESLVRRLENSIFDEVTIHKQEPVKHDA